MYNNGKVVRDRLGDSIDALKDAIAALEVETDRRSEGYSSNGDRYTELYVSRVTNTLKKCIDLQDHVRLLVYGG